jgi:hypothetical protein
LRLKTKCLGSCSGRSQEKTRERKYDDSPADAQGVHQDSDTPLDRSAGPAGVYDNRLPLAAIRFI